MKMFCHQILATSRRHAVAVASFVVVFAVATSDIRADPPLPPNPLIENIADAETILQIDPQRSKLIRTRAPVTRISITNPAIVEVIQFGPKEFELVGGQAGETTLTIWFDDPVEGSRFVRYIVQVGRDDATEERVAVEYGRLQNQINELFPNSAIQLIPISDKIVLRGQARDPEEATEILSILTNRSVDQTGRSLGPGSFVNVGTAARPFGAEDIPASNIINLMDVPGEMQIMLKVRVLTMSRSANREAGADFSAMRGDFQWESLFGGVAGAARAILDTDEVRLTLEAISSSSYSKVLAEPNLVTLNGRPATFFSGGEFAVPVVVGVQGAAAATTNFRGFGTQLSFTPTLIDKDRFRLTVAPSISGINAGLTVDGIPGLNSTAVFTTVDLREGQWLAIAGLIEDQQSGSKTHVPWIGNVPILDMFFSNREISREEAELIVLVSPELVTPMDPHETPLILPGMEITEPNDFDFFIMGYYEGRPGCNHRSTVWPIYQQRVYENAWKAYHEAKRGTAFVESEEVYIHGAHGFSE